MVNQNDDSKTAHLDIYYPTHREVLRAFRSDLEALIDKHNVTKASNTHSSILAEYLTQCLANFDVTVELRHGWNGE